MVSVGTGYCGVLSAGVSHLTQNVKRKIDIQECDGLMFALAQFWSSPKVVGQDAWFI